MAKQEAKPYKEGDKKWSMRRRVGSQIVEASWASVFNDDKKLIAFSDSVQDAAHRAGFFGARTWLNNVRTAWAHVLDELQVSSMPWAQFLALAEKRFDEPGSVLHLPPETLVAEFLAPNMTWQHDWSVELLQNGQLPASTRLPGKVRKRLLWQLFSDLTYQSQRGRTLERVGKATLSVPWQRVQEVASQLLPVFREQFGAQGLELPLLTQWLWGTLLHMRRRGGVMHPAMTLYAGDGNLLSATPTLEMGVDIGDLSSVLLCSVPPNQASFLQRMGRAGRRDGNAMTTTLADGNSPHDLYFFAETEEMIAGDVAPPGVFLQAAEVLRRQLFAFCMDDWVSSLSNATALPEKTSQALDAMEQTKLDRFPYIFCDHVLKHEQRLFDDFMALLGKDVDDVVRGRLWDFMQGQGDSDGLRTRLMKALEELVEERRTYKKRKDQLDARRGVVAQRPQDEATQHEIDSLLRERDKMLELIKEINGRDLLNTLTDAGLIPNYAFPESGIQLKSVLWRKRGADEPGQGAYVSLATQKYERPAQSALSEFAPENRFYANQRRVEVDQINMNLAKTEEWRFCPSCHHMQNLVVEPDVHTTCPNCGDPMWSDGGKKHTLLRFRQAIANSNDTDVRIDDSSEDREPKYYVRQLMADFQPSAIREAWQIPTGGTPFGFEFISRVTFRDVNFGELAKPGDAFKVADTQGRRDMHRAPIAPDRLLNKRHRHSSTEGRGDEVEAQRRETLPTWCDAQ